MKVLRLLVFTMLLSALTGTVWGADITSVSVTSTTITLTQGTTTNNAFTARINSISGSVPPHPHNPAIITYCSEWTSHSDGSVACDTYSNFALTNGRNYSLFAVTSSDNLSSGVTINVDADAPCNVIYTVPEAFTSAGGNGVDFGNGVLQVTDNVYVTVACSSPAGYQGCSAGYWRNHTGSWPTGYMASTKVSDVFSSAGISPYAALGGQTLEYTLQHPGGGSTLAGKANVLLFQAIAGVLNAATSAINYSIEPASAIVNDVNNALDNARVQNDGSILTTLGTTLDGYNNLGAPVCADSLSFQ